MAVKFLDVGNIVTAKGSGKLYIKLNQVTNKEGKYVSDNLKELSKALINFIENPNKDGLPLQFDTPQSEIRRLTELGYIKEEDVEKRLDSIPSYIKYKIKYVKED